MTVNMGPSMRCPTCYSEMQMADSGRMYCPSYQCGGPQSAWHTNVQLDMDDLARRIAKEVVKELRQGAAKEFADMLKEELANDGRVR